MDTVIMEHTIKRRIGLFLLPLLGSWFYRIWFATCRIRSHSLEKRHEAENMGKPLIGICWHYCILPIFAIYRDYPLTLMISTSKDGEYLARMVERLGFPVVRGSSNRHGARAARQLIRELRRGNHTGLVADGSQGPARIAQQGSLFMAANSGAVIVPVLYSVSRYYSFKTWDKLILPKLFSTIDVFYGEPVILPAGAKGEQLKKFRRILEENLNTIYVKAWLLYDKYEH